MPRALVTSTNTSPEPPRFSVALRFFHPSIDPRAISSKLGIEAEFSWKAGAPRTTPSGKPLRGLNKASYWVSSRAAPKEEDLSTFLIGWIRELERHREFFSQLASEDGRIEFYLMWSIRRFRGDSITVEALRALAELNIDFTFEAFK